MTKSNRATVLMIGDPAEESDVLLADAVEPSSQPGLQVPESTDNAAAPGPRSWFEHPGPEPLPGLRPWSDVAYEGWEALLAGRNTLVLAPPFGARWLSRERLPPGRYVGEAAEQEPDEHTWRSLWRSHHLAEWVSRSESTTLVLLPSENRPWVGDATEPTGTWHEGKLLLETIGRGELRVRTDSKFSSAEPIADAGPLSTVWEAGLSELASGYAMYRASEWDEPSRGIALRPASAPLHIGFVGVGGTTAGGRLLIMAARPIRTVEHVEAALAAAEALRTLESWTTALEASQTVEAARTVDRHGRVPPPPSSWSVSSTDDATGDVVRYTVSVPEVGSIELNPDHGKALEELQRRLIDGPGKGLSIEELNDLLEMAVPDDSEYWSTFISRLRSALRDGLEISEKWLRQHLKKRQGGPYRLID